MSAASSTSSSAHFLPSPRASSAEDPRGGPQKGQPKLPPPAKTLVDRGLMRIDRSSNIPRLFFTGAGTAALRQMMWETEAGGIPRNLPTSGGSLGSTRTSRARPLSETAYVLAQKGGAPLNAQRRAWRQVPPKPRWIQPPTAPNWTEIWHRFGASSTNPRAGYGRQRACLATILHLTACSASLAWWPRMLREFVSGPWLDDLDLDGMERLNAKFRAEHQQRREGDMTLAHPAARRRRYLPGATARVPVHPPTIGCALPRAGLCWPASAALSEGTAPAARRQAAAGLRGRLV